MGLRTLDLERAVGVALRLGAIVEMIPLGVLGTLGGLGALGSPPVWEFVGLGTAVATLTILTAKIWANPKKAMQTLFSRPHRGDVVLLEIYGADLSTFLPNGQEDTAANKRLEGWWGGKPDCYVKFIHGNQHGRTQVEGDTYHPRYYFQRKVPLYKNEGFEFQVWEFDVFDADKIVGRCYVTSDLVHDSMANEQPILISLGLGVGQLKVLFHGPLTYADRQHKLLTDGEIAVRKKINDKRGVTNPAMVIGQLTKEQKATLERELEKTEDAQDRLGRPHFTYTRSQTCPI